MLNKRLKIPAVDDEQAIPLSDISEPRLPLLTNSVSFELRPHPIGMTIRLSHNKLEQITSETQKPLRS